MKETAYYDIGLNLFCRQFKKPEKIITDAWKEGVCCILTGADMKTNWSVDGFVKRYDSHSRYNHETRYEIQGPGNHDIPAVYGTAGIHPHSADEARKEDFFKMEHIFMSNPKIIAVGECGLDYDRMYSTRENQLRCLDHHIMLAEKLGKPMFLHERAAAKDFIARFQKHPEVCTRSVVHCFTGDKKTVEQYLEMGFFIGITGWICDDRRADDLREAVSSIPLDRILLETDAPYLTPRNVEGLERTNVPQNIKYVSRELAKYMDVDEQELISHAKENTERLFLSGVKSTINGER